MAWQTIAASETDANSPLNQTLMDKIRGNLDYLHSVGAQLKFLFGTLPNETGSGDIVLDQELDWRDRYLFIRGVVHQAHVNDLGKTIPGGSWDIYLGGDYSNLLGASPNQTYPLHVNSWFYSAGGGAARTDDPKVQISIAPSFTTSIYFWTDSTSGRLYLGFQTNRGTNLRNFTWNLMLIYSEDQGAH